MDAVRCSGTVAMMDRPTISMPLQRASGLTPVVDARSNVSTMAIELAHIEPWSQVREHSFENLIALCRPDTPVSIAARSIAHRCASTS
jgi:hypothetical protein